MDAGRVTRRTLIAGVSTAVAVRATSAGGVVAPAVSGPAVASAPARRALTPEHLLPGWTAGTIGASLDGRPIERLDDGPERPERHVAVICGIHGDERAAVDLVNAFGRIDRPDDLQLTIVPLANPDGWASGTRRNARGVDLNRNFPWRWPGRYDSGAGPASEPETQAVMAFVENERPDLVVWVHQPLNYVAALEGCPESYADIWSDFSGVPVRRNLTQVGGGESWTAGEAGLRSMLIEVGGHREAALGVSAHANALEALIQAVQPT